MAILTNKITGQVMEIANTAHFLSAVTDASDWDSDEIVVEHVVDSAPAIADVTEPVAVDPSPVSVEAPAIADVETPVSELVAPAVEAVEGFAAPIESAIATAFHSVESFLETTLNIIEGK
jgi:hypothetical protein